MNDYFVIHRYTCPGCNGDRVFQHPLWARYWAENGPGKRNELEWFAANGWPVYSWDELPPEELTCPDCNGRGEVEREVPLAEALAALGLGLEIAKVFKEMEGHI